MRTVAKPGDKIRILNTAGHTGVTIGGIYTVNNIYTDNNMYFKIMFEGLNIVWATNPEDYQILPNFSNYYDQIPSPGQAIGK